MRRTIIASLRGSYRGSAPHPVLPGVGTFAHEIKGF